MGEWEKDSGGGNNYSERVSSRATTGTVLGATALGLAGIQALQGGLGRGLLGGVAAQQATPVAAAAPVQTIPIQTVPVQTVQPMGCCCNEQIPVNRYEAAQSAKIAELETQIQLRDSNTYTDQKILDVYRHFDGEIRDVRNTLCAQAVQNQKTADAFEMVRNDMHCMRNELYTSINAEKNERCCADNALVAYMNGTFYPKMVADVTTGTETTAATLYNPLPRCGCGCGCGS